MFNTILLSTIALLYCVHPTQSLAIVPLHHTIPPTLVHLGIGATSGAAGAFVAYPLDLVKAQLQTEYGRAKYGTDGIGAAFDIMRRSPLGPLALYRGCLVQIAGIAPEKTIKLTVNDFMRTYINIQMGYLPIGGEIVAGGVAGLAQVIITNPLEVCKLKLQTSGADYTLRDALDEVGSIAGMYKGAGACVARDVIFSACLFPSFAHLKVIIPSLLVSTLGGDVDPLWCNLLAGSIAAAPAAFIATPCDTVKTRLQQAREQGDGMHKHGDAVHAELDVNAMVLVRTLGIEVLFSGWYERVVRSCVQFGVTLSLFDLLTTKAKEIGMV